jgi:hypothetical protein
MFDKIKFMKASWASEHQETDWPNLEVLYSAATFCSFFFSSPHTLALGNNCLHNTICGADSIAWCTLAMNRLREWTHEEGSDAAKRKFPDKGGAGNIKICDAAVWPSYHTFPPSSFFSVPVSYAVKSFSSSSLNWPAREHKRMRPDRGEGTLYLGQILGQIHKVHSFSVRVASVWTKHMFKEKRRFVSDVTIMAWNHHPDKSGFNLFQQQLQLV